MDEVLIHQREGIKCHGGAAWIGGAFGFLINDLIHGQSMACDCVCGACNEWCPLVGKSVHILLILMVDIFT
jgi:hypothetical protein